MSDAAAFEAQRPRLTRLAYRMLGSLADAEDAVQDAWLRWTRVDSDEVQDPAAWLTRATTRLCLDRLRAARVAREAYKGPWLPEPLIEDPVDPVERAEDISVAFLVALERLSPLERAVLILHDVLDEDYGDIAETLGREEAACRQILSRARAHIRQARPRFGVTQDEVKRLAGAFMAAMSRSDPAALSELLAEDAILVTDGGGKRAAALRPLVGRADILRLLERLIWRGTWKTPTKVRIARINGQLGAVLADAEGLTTFVAEVDGEGRLAAIYVQRNPEKLGRAAEWLDHA
ncbi:MAG TPA: RNA polymerase sigma factor SigJ [Caulobacteraceae bacterium]|nr:RNA polymerase sigma factor SigJ [Caulobacteraceae bacterium]